MKKIGVSILGLGTVGGGTYKILTENHDHILKTQDLDVNVVSVLEINLERTKALGIDNKLVKSSIDEVINDKNVDIVVEVIGGIKIAKEFVLAALKSGKTVVTANKELIAKYWHELEKAAKENKAGLYFEASCVGGVPIIRTLIDSMQGDCIESLSGIINGTTNYILSKMSDEGLDYDSVLKEAQSLGYAEANPSADVEGFDAAYKLSILSSLAFKKKIPLKYVYREGISNVSIEDIKYGKELGLTLKLLAIGKNTESGFEIRVHPTFIDNSHPLATVKGSFNAVHIYGNNVGDIMLYGRGAGDLPTGSAIVSDVVYAGKKLQTPYYTPFNNSEDKEDDVVITSDFLTDYYMRLSVIDIPGVLAKVTAVFSKYNVSITDVIQKGNSKNNSVPLIFITHKTKESSIQNALKEIREIDSVVEVASVIRVEK